MTRKWLASSAAHVRGYVAMQWECNSARSSWQREKTARVGPAVTPNLLMSSKSSQLKRPRLQGTCIDLLTTLAQGRSPYTCPALS